MNRIILLATKWSADYWHHSKEANYRGFNYNFLNDWNDLQGRCPIAGIGYYIIDKCNVNFVYLIIKEMKYDNNGTPYFDFEFLSQSTTPSIQLTKKLPQENIKNLFTSSNGDIIINILNELNEIAPESWLSLIKNNSTDQENNQVVSIRTTTIKQQDDNWLKFVGNYFQEIVTANLSNNEFEDRVASLLNSIGFKVRQKGFQIIGAFCDGIAILDNDYAMVYDCKNMTNYYSTSENNRAMDAYVNEEKNMLQQRNIFGVFIAKSFSHNNNNNFNNFSVESLIYLLYKKLMLGERFNLLPLRNILNGKMNFDLKCINNYWT